MRLRLSWYREVWYVFLLTVRRTLPFPESLGFGFPSFWYVGKREPGIDLCRRDFDSANDLPHVFCNRLFRKCKPREYRFSIAKHAWSIFLRLKNVNTLPATLTEGRAYRWCWDSPTARFRPSSYTFFIMHVADIKSVSTPSMTYCVVINVQIIIIRVVQRAQSKTA